MRDPILEAQRSAAAYCPTDLSHAPYQVGSQFCAKCGARLEFGVKPRSRIESWGGWPDDVREVLRGWNKSKGLSFRGMPYWGCRLSTFTCSDCGLLCEAARYGVATLKDRKLCDDCLIDRARGTIVA